MSIRIMSRIWEFGPEKQGERFVLLALADFCNDAGECWPSIAAIARKTCMTERGVRQILRRLEADGWLSTDVNGGRSGCNKYVVNPERGSPRNEVPPGTKQQQTRNVVPLPPEPRSAEPSLNHQEPSEEPPCIPPDETKPKQKRAVALPEGWVPSDRNIADAISRDFTEKEIQHEADQFRDYHHARGTTFKDWDAAWRTWLGNVRKFQGRRMAGQSAPGRYGQGSSLASVVARRQSRG